MSSVAPRRSPPQKKGNKKSKRHSSNDDPNARFAKAQRVQSNDDCASGSFAPDEHDDATQSNVLLQEPRRSGRVGAGVGGKAEQLEKIGTILERRDARSTNSTSLPEGMVPNPLAPPSRHAKLGRHNTGKKTGLNGPPPPYVPAVQTQAHSMATTAPVPVFHRRLSESERFGFSAPSPAPQPIVPPGTVPNPLALSNPHAGSREEQARHSNSLPLLPDFSQQSPSTAQYVGQPRLVKPRTLESQSIDPALLATSDVTRKPSFPVNPHVTQTDAATCYVDSGSDSTSGSNEMTSSLDEADEVEPDREQDDDGWGMTNSRREVHPGFFQDYQQNNPSRHNSLPPDHEFTFSRSEDDDSARANLANLESQRDTPVALQSRHRINKPAVLPRNLEDVPPQGGITVATQPRHPRPDGPPNAMQNGPGNVAPQLGDAVDVLSRHHEVNGQPSAPDPQRLIALASTQQSGCSRAPRNSKKAKDAGPSPQNLGFYPAIWQDCLEDAKRECRVSHLLSNNPFPSKSRDLNTSITDALTTTITEWNDGGAVFEPDYWPNYKSGMACVLLGDMSTWRSELKTTAFAVASTEYGLIPPQNIAPREKPQWVQDAAIRLLDDALFLRGGFDELGKTNNFAHPAIKETVIKFFYTGSYRIADKRQNLFRQAVPVSCLALVGAALNCMLDGFAKNGAANLKMMPQFTGKAYRSTFLAMIKMLNKTLDHAYHGPKMHTQLGRWAEDGWAALHEVDVDVERDSHLRVILD